MMQYYFVRFLYLSFFFLFANFNTIKAQDAACGEIVPVTYNECVNGDIPIFSSLCDVTFSMTPYTVFPQTSICDLPGSITNNPRFVAFVANGLELVDITVIPSNCTFNGGTQGIQAALLGSCSALDPVGTCQTTCPGINPINLVTDVIPNAGDIIYLMVDGCAFSVCDFVIEFNGGVDVPDAEMLPGTVIIGPSEICEETTYVIDPPFEDVCNYYWTLPDGTMVTTNIPEITFTPDPDMPPGQLCVQGDNDCNPGDIVPSAPGLCIDVQLAGIEYDFTMVQPTCGLDNGEIEITILDGTEPISYNWSPGTVTGNGGTDLAPGDYLVTITDANGCFEVLNINLEESEPLEATVVTVDIDCATNTLGSATINVIGGTGNFNYTWDPDVSTTNSGTDLSAGDYSVTITDQNITGCEVEIDFTIEIIGELEIDVVTEESTCDLDNGSILVTPNGVGPYTYTWSNPGLFNDGEGLDLPAGTYNVTIIDEGTGCEKEESITIEESEPLEATVVTVDIDCATNTLGSATITVIGGTGNYNYTWDPDISTTNSGSDLSTGDYSVTITDQNISGCEVEIDFTIEIVGELEIEVVTEATTCDLDNGSILVTPNGVGPYTYTWSNPGLFNDGEGLDLPAGTYNVTIIDEGTGCEREESITIDDSEEPEVSETIVNPNCDGTLGSISLSILGGSGIYSYIWNPNVSTGNSATNLDAGTYFITITDLDIPGCDIEVDYELEFEGELPVDISVQDTECNLDNGSITVTPNGIGPYNFAWDPAGFFTEGSGSNLPAGSYDVTIIDETSGCEREETITVADSDPIVIIPTVINANCNGNLGSINLNVTGGSGNFTYTWSPDVSNGSTANNLVGGTYDITVTDIDIPGCSTEISVDVIYVGTIPLFVTTIPTTCNLPNGSITVVPDGVGPYIFTWSNPPLFNEGVGTDLPAGNYTVTVVDETTGCEQIQNIFVQPSPPLNISSTVINAECDGTLGSIILNVTNGSGEYSYTWDPAVSTSNVATNLEHGIYNITVVDNQNNNCTNAISVNVGLDGELPVEFTSLPTTCSNPNGSIELFPYGDGPFSFQWIGLPGVSENFAINLASGVYTVIVTDLENGCTNTLEIEIEDSEPLGIDSEIIEPTCNLANGSATVLGLGGSGAYNFEWSTPNGSGDFADNLAPGLYFVTMSDNSDPDCFIILDIEIPDSPPLEVTFIELIDTECGLPNGSILVEVFNGSGNYLYVLNGNDIGGNSISNLAPGDYQLTVSDLDISGCQITVDFFIDFSDPPATPILQGLTELCISDGIGTYTVSNYDDSYIFDWRIINGEGDIIFGDGTDSIVIDWQGGEDGLICVDVFTDCGFSPEQCLPVILVNNPIIELGGDIAVCGSETTINGTISNGMGTWTVVSGPGNVTFSNINNPGATVSVDELGEYVLRFSANQSGCTSTDEITINFNEGVEYVIIEDCSEITTYIVEITITSGLAPYFINSGNISGSFNGNIFTSDPITSGQSYNLVIEDANGCLSSVIVGQRECSCDTGAGDMQTNTIRECVGNPIQGIHISGTENGDATTVFEYILFSNQLNPEGTILFSSADGLFNFDPATMTAGVTYYIAYVAGIDAGDGSPDYSDICLDISNGQPVIWYDYPSGVIAGDLDLCGLTTTLNLTGMYNELEWILINGPGTADFSPSTSANTNLSVSNSGIYTIGVALVNGGTCRDTISQEVEFFPGDLSIIFGPSVECNSIGTEFQIVVELEGGSGSYILVDGAPVGGTFNGSTFTSEFISVDENYSFTFTDSNGCDTLSVSGIGECDCITRVGSIVEPLIELCYGQDLVFTYDPSNEVLIPGDVVTYVLYEGTLNLINNILNISQNPEFPFSMDIIPGQTYYIRVIAGQDDGSGFADWNDPCLSESISIPVIWYEVPGGEIEEVDPICDLIIDLSINSQYTNMQWSIESGPGSGTFDPIDGNTTQFTASTPGIYVISALISNQDLCFATLTQTIEILPNDLALVDYDISCDDLGTEFEVNINLSTSDGPVVFIESESSHTGTLSGNTFTSEVIATGGSYTFTFTDNGGCDTVVISDIGLCDCETRVGSIIETLIEACDGDDISFTYDSTNEILVPGDVVTYILYEGTLNTINNIISYSSTNSFEFLDGIILGQTYYIRVLAGQDDGTGIVDFEDPCLVESISIPVIWYEIPEGIIFDVDPTCDNSLELIAEGQFESVEWTILNGPSGGNLSPNTGENVTFTATQAGIYTIQIEMTNEICSNEFSIEIEILESDLSISDWDFVCNDLGTEFEVNVNLAGGNGNYILLPESSHLGNIVNSTFTSSSIITDTEFTFYFTDTNGCDTLELTGIGLCNCITRVGSITNTLIEACDGESISFNYNDANEVLDPDDVLNFILYEGTATDITNIIDISTVPTFAFPAGIILGNTYYIQAVAGNDNGMGDVDENDPCIRRSTSRPVIWHPFPEGNIPKIDPVCGNSTLVEVLGEFDQISWSVISGPGTLTFADPENAQTEIEVSESGIYTVLATLTNAGLCVLEIETTIEFIESNISFEDRELICDDTNTTFQIQLNLIGGTGEYLLDNSSPNTGSFSGNTFVSETFPNGSAYEFWFTDSDGCETLIVSGIGDCNCESQVGDITNTTIELCDGEDIVFNYNNENEFLDADDVLIFILYEGSPNQIDNILATNTTSQFDFPDGIILGNVYYIQAIVGNSDGAGGIDENDPCLSRSTSRPVVWRPIPQAIGMVDGVIGCENSSVQLFGTSDLGGSDAGINILWFNQNGEGIGESGTVNVSTPGQYNVKAENSIGCSTRDTVEVEADDGIITEVNALIKDPTCIADENGFIEIVNVMGGAEPYEYSFNGGPFGPIKRWDDLGDGVYNIRITDANGCETSRNIPVNNPLPVDVNLGLNLTISEGQEINVGSTIFPENTIITNYLWTFNAQDLNCPDCNIINFTPGESGILSLLITDIDGCQAEDQINVTILPERRVIYIPNAFSPNGDQFNDIFRIYNYDDVEIINSFSIFDRWGSFIYGSENIEPGNELASWDGRYNGEEVNQAVFVYQIKLTFKNGDVRVYAGDVTLFR